MDDISLAIEMAKMTLGVVGMCAKTINNFRKLKFGHSFWITKKYANRLLRTTHFTHVSANTFCKF